MDAKTIGKKDISIPVNGVASNVQVDTPGSLVVFVGR